MRKFVAREVEVEELEAVLRAGTVAPSVGNQRPRKFYIVRDREKLEALSQISRYAGPVTAVPFVITAACDLVSKRFTEVAPIDTAIYTEHLWLGVVSEGLGGVWIGVYPFEGRVKSANRTLGIPAGQFVFSVPPLGYSVEGKAPEDCFDPTCIHEM